MKQAFISKVNKVIELQKAGKFIEAVEPLKELIAEQPKHLELINSLAFTYEKINQPAHAIKAYEKSLAINPRQANVCHNLGQAHFKYGNDYVLALNYFKKSFQFGRKTASLFNDMAFAYYNFGAYEEAIQYYESAYKIDPQPMYLNHLVFNYHYDPSKTPADFKKLAKKYHQSIEDKSIKKFTHPERDIKKAKLRVGFVSGDLRKHPVSFHLLPLLRCFDKVKFEIYLYSSRHSEDDYTQQLKQQVQSFKEIESLSDAEAANLIKNDAIDVLFDLSGFTKYERLNVFKYKPAPLQIHHIGYFATLGIPEMDFIIADKEVVKIEEEQHFLEKVYKFDNMYFHCDLPGIPEINPEPAFKRNGYVTIGSFSTFRKCSKQVLETWAEILKLAPDAKFLIESRTLAALGCRDYALNIFKENGVDLQRIEIRNSVERDKFLSSYHDIDIQLDPFPYGAGATAVESLMMGVPIVTKLGDRWISRQATSILKTIGIEDLIARDLKDYVKIASRLAKNTDAIAEYRASLRDKLLTSDMNISTYTRNFEKAIFEMWKS